MYVIGDCVNHLKITFQSNKVCDEIKMRIRTPIIYCRESYSNIHTETDLWRRYSFWIATKIACHLVSLNSLFYFIWLLLFVPLAISFEFLFSFLLLLVLLLSVPMFPFYGICSSASTSSSPIFFSLLLVFRFNDLLIDGVYFGWNVYEIDCVGLIVETFKSVQSCFPRMFCSGKEIQKSSFKYFFL